MTEWVPNVLYKEIKFVSKSAVMQYDRCEFFFVFFIYYVQNFSGDVAKNSSMFPAENQQYT
jgi:hypothetical protein